MDPKTPEEIPKNRPINWLFFDPVNIDSLVHCISASPDPDLCPGNLAWSYLIQQNFRVKLDRSTIRFWQVTYRPQPFCFPHLTFFSQPIVPLPIKSVDRSWIENHPSIDDVARFCQPALPVTEAFEEPWDRSQVHFLITAKALADD